MAMQQTVLYVTAYFSVEGQFRNFALDRYKPSGEMNEYGMSVVVREIEYQYEVPDNMNEVNILAAGALDAFIKKEKGAHQMRMMKMEAALNSMRGIGYPEVLEREAPRRPQRWLTGSTGEANDIPL